jgi:thiamine kinase-like enzyme
LSVQAGETLIPEEKILAVSRGLREAFDIEEYEDIRRITVGNATSRVFRIVAAGRPFLLKIILRKDDATRHYACMKAAAEAGLAPRVRYASVENKVFITDFVEAAPFPAEDALVRIPVVLRALHALPPFPRIPHNINTSCMFLLNKGPALEEFLGRFQAANILPKAESEELFRRYAQIAAVYPEQADMVSSHNDLFKPDNILFDGDRVWLVDWEAAFLNDRYADLAVVANMLVADDADETLFLEQYFGGPPDEYQRARFSLMQQVSHIFYAMAFLFLGSSGQAVAWSESMPGFREFQRRLWAGEIDLKDKQMKVAYGRIHLEQLLHNVRQPRFEETLRILANVRCP